MYTTHLLTRLLVLLLMSFPGLRAGETEGIRHLLVNEGQANNHIRAMTQDRGGRLWIATESGLNSYDGYSSFNYNSSNSGLNANMVNVIHDDGRQLWIGTTGGVCVMDGQTGIIQPLGGGASRISNVQAFVPDADRGLWMMSRNDILYVDLRTHQTRRLTASRERNAYRCMADDGHGSLLVGNYYRGLCRIDMQTGRRTLISDSAHAIDQTTAVKMCRDGRGNIWIATTNGLWRMNGAGQLLRFDNSVLQNVRELQVTHDNELWVGTEEKVWKIRLDTYEVSPATAVGGVQCIYQDPYGNVWMGTMGFGIYLIGHRQTVFRAVSRVLTQSLLRVGSRVFVGGEGLVMCFQNGRQTATYPLSKGGFGGRVLSVGQEDARHLVLAMGNRLLRMDMNTGAVAELRHRGRSVTAITFYNDYDNNKLWITADDGIYALSQGTVQRDSMLNRVLGRQMTNGIRRDRQGKLWVGTFDNGLYVFSPQGRLVKHFTQQNGFFTNNIQHLYEDGKGRIWLCTPDGIGLVADTRRPDRCLRFGQRQGLCDPFIRCMHEDRDGNIWIGTNNGISKLDMRRRSFFNFDRNDGIPMSNFSGGMTLMPDGTMYVTSMEGLCVFDAEETTRPRRPSPVRVLSCLAILPGVEQMRERRLQIDGRGCCRLSREENSLRIVFAVADLSESARTEYAYRVEGLADDWTLVGENYIVFRGLSPGTYRVQIRARLHGQTWENSAATEVAVEVPGPLWRSWPARCAYLLVLVLGAAYGFRRYQGHLKLVNDLDLERRRKLAEEEQGRERLQFFTNVAHELRTPLTLIFGPLEELAHSRNLGVEDRQKVTLLQGSARRLLLLINQLMDFRKAETRHRRLKVRRQQLAPLLEKIGSDFAQANRNPRVGYAVRAEADAPPICFDEEVMTIILTNLLANAMKYTEQGTVTLSMDQTEHEGKTCTRVCVADTGCGIAHEDLPRIFDRYYQARSGHQASGTGIGLALVKTLAELHHIRILVDSHEGQGTVFTLLLENDATYPEALVDERPAAPVLRQARDTVQGQNAGESQPIILIVEDNKEINDYMAQSLSPDYTVVQAGNGEEGLRAARADIPDLIICDVMMPQMDGITMTRLIKQDMMTSHIPVVMLTAKTTMDDRQEGYENGADSYLTKPFSLSVLRTRIANLLESRRMLAWHVMQQFPGPTAALSLSRPGDAAVIPAAATEQGDGQEGLGKLDRRFMAQLNGIIGAHLANPKLNLPLVAGEMGISQSTLYRKVKALTGITTNEYIRKMRLRHALQLMTDGGRNISEAAYESGFGDLAYFRQAFRQEYGTTPSDYLHQP